METKVKSNTAPSANTDKKDNNTTNLRPSVPGKDRNDETATKTNAQSTAAAQSQNPAPAAAATVATAQSAVPEPVKAVEPTKKELKAELQETKARGLDDTVKLVEELGKKIAQKNKLFNTVSNLDAFVVSQSDDKDDVSSDSKYPRCELVISDDGGEEFVTKNPFIIARVVEMVKQLCIEKLAEVEATIIIP